MHQIQPNFCLDNGETLTNVDFGKDKRFDISNADKPPSATIFTASSRNSLV